MKPYHRDRGGVVRISFASDRCASSNFLDTLKLVHESYGGRSIRIDREIYTVRYLSGIRDEFIRLLGMKLSMLDQTPGNATLNVQCGLEANGNVTAQASSIQQSVSFGENPELMTRTRNLWLKELCDQIAAFLKHSRFMVIINHGDRGEQDEFWRYLWRGALETLVQPGLVLVHMVDSSGTQEIHELAPVANLEFELPASLTVRAQAHATEDIAAILMAEFPSLGRDLAHARADVLVGSNSDNIRRLHVKHAAHLLKLAEQAKQA